MNWAAFIGPLLTAKISLVVLIGQLFIYSLVFEHVDTHNDRMYEVVLFSLILWVGYMIISYTNSKIHNDEIRKLELYSDEMLLKVESKHTQLESELKSRISELESKFKEDDNVESSQ